MGSLVLCKMIVQKLCVSNKSPSHCFCCNYPAWLVVQRMYHAETCGPSRSSSDWICILVIIASVMLWELGLCHLSIDPSLYSQRDYTSARHVRLNHAPISLISVRHHTSNKTKSQLNALFILLKTCSPYSLKGNGSGSANLLMSTYGGVCNSITNSRGESAYFRYPSLMKDEFFPRNNVHWKIFYRESRSTY